MENKAVFLSYASQDVDAARGICEALREAGVEVWFDQSELRGGDAWDAKIRKQIKECALFVPVISANTQGRPEGYFRLEWRLADQRTHLMGKSKAFLVPVCIDDTRDSEADVPDSFTGVQWVRIPRGENAGDFAARVRQLLTGDVGRGLPTPLPHEAGKSPAGSGDPSLHRRRLWPWIVGAAAAIGLVAVAWWQSGQRRTSPPTSAVPTASASAPAGSNANPSPLTEARQLVAKAEALLEPHGNATREDFVLAEKWCEQAAQLAPRDADVWAAYAIVTASFIPTGLDRSDARFDAAGRRARQAIKLAPDSPTAQFALANYYRMQPATRNEALTMLMALVPKMPGDKRLLRTIGYCYRDRGEAEEALRWYDRAAALPGGDVQAIFNRGQMLLLEQRREEGEAEIDRSLALQPMPLARLWKTALLLQRGELGAARTMLGKVPGEWLLDDLGATVAAQLWLWRNDVPRALAVLRSFPRDYFQQATEAPKALLLGLAHERAGNRDAAAAEWTGAYRLVEQRLEPSPADPVLLRLQAFLLAKLGRGAEAERALRASEQQQGRGGGSLLNRSLPAATFAALGQPDEAIVRIEALLAKPTGFFPLTTAALRYDPLWDPLRPDPRFQALLNRAPASAPASTNPKSIAVLPFENLSADKENEFFAAGVREEILSALQLVRDLRVASVTSASAKSPREVARDLNVPYALECSVRRAGDQVRVTCHLLRTANQEVVFTQTYDKPLRDVFAVQSELALAIAGKLRAALLPDEKRLLERRPTKDLAAYDLYLQARVLRSRGYNMSTLGRQEALLADAVQRDPDFAVAWASLAWVHGYRYFKRDDRRSDHSPARAQKAADAIARALELAPDEPETILSRGYYYFFVTQEYARAREQFEKLVRARANDAASVYALAEIQGRLGQWPAAVASYQRAAELDPANLNYLRNLYYVAKGGRRYDLAGAALRRIIALEPNSRLEQGWLAWIPFHAAGRTDELEAWLGSRSSDEALLHRRWLAYAKGDYTAAVQQLGDAVNKSDDLQIATLCLMTGEKTAAMAIAARAADLQRELLARDPEFPLALAELAMAEALLGARDQALRDAHRAVEVAEQSGDAWQKPWTTHALAFVYAWTGDKDRAIAELARLLNMPFPLGAPDVHVLRVSPSFSPLRGDPRFEALLNDPKNNAPLF